jgi:hypothetical protein
MNGLIKIKDEDYFKLPYLSTSSLKLFVKSPAHMLAGIDKTPSMEKGIMIHKWVLEKDTFFEDYATIPEELKEISKSTKAYQEWKKSNTKEVVSDNDIIMLEAIENNLKLLKHDSGMSYFDILQESKKEYAIIDKIEEVDFKGKIDAFHEGLKLIIDLKSCQDALDFKFKAKYQNYQWQAWAYSELLLNVYLDSYDFIFLAIETSKPFGIKAYRCTLNDLADSEMQVKKEIQKYKKWVEAGKPYQIYSDEIDTLYI